MKEITILDRKFGEMIPASDIDTRITEMAEEINRDYEGKEVVFLVTERSFYVCFGSFRRIRLDAKISFVKLVCMKG